MRNLHVLEKTRYADHIALSCRVVALKLEQRIGHQVLLNAEKVKGSVVNIGF